MPKGRFIESDASDLSKFRNIKFDMIFVISVFQYFKSISYSKIVLKK